MMDISRRKAQTLQRQTDRHPFPRFAFAGHATLADRLLFVIQFRIYTIFAYKETHEEGQLIIDS